MQYQWEAAIGCAPKKKNYQSHVGVVVLERKQKRAYKTQITVLIDNPKTQVYLVGPFNDWGNKDRDAYKLIADEHSVYASLQTTALTHQTPYKLLVCSHGTQEYMQDPAGYYFDDHGNTIFWDFDDPRSYKQVHPFVDTVTRATKVLQTDLPGLLVHWADKKGVLGRDIEQKNYYRFIADSGIIEHIKELGFNTVQFLPFAQNIDGDNWKYRYLVPFQFAIQKNWGTPDDFAYMIDMFHKNGIAVIGDFVIGHLPFKDYRIFGHDGEKNGIQCWVNRHGTRLFMKEETSWGTMRIDYDNPHVRDFMVASCLHFLDRYKIDGLRIDNVDGILRYGVNGDEQERPHGRTFLRQLHKEIYDYNPLALIHLEAHYFHEDNAKLLVIPFDQDTRALGATAYTNSRLAYYFHTVYMLMDGKKVSAWKFKHIIDEMEWGQSNSTISDFHNHDAAAGLMHERATGSYAYDTMTHKQPHNHLHAIGKIKVMEAIISFLGEGRTLDLIQTFLLQKGTFEHDSSIQWFLTFTQCNKNMVAYKQAVNQLMDDPAFWPQFTKNRRVLNVDEQNKILVVERSSEYKGKQTRYVIVINLTSWNHYNYKVGVRTKNPYSVVLNSDLFEYSGLGLVSYPLVLLNQPSTQFEVLDREVVLSQIAPYGVVVLQEQTQ